MIRKQIEGGFSNLMFTTIEYIKTSDNGQKGKKKKILLGTVQIVDDDLKGLSDTKKYEIGMSEKEYHTKLRKQAAERQHLITSHSTDPEWNPEGYIKNLEDELKR